jgi:hypothetical protein
MITIECETSVQSRSGLSVCVFPGPVMVLSMLWSGEERKSYYIFTCKGRVSEISLQQPFLIEKAGLHYRIIFGMIAKHEI